MKYLFAVFALVGLLGLSGCSTLSLEALDRMEPGQRVQYRDGLETADKAIDEAIDIYDGAYDRNGMPKPAPAPVPGQ